MSQCVVIETTLLVDYSDFMERLKLVVSNSLISLLRWDQVPIRNVAVRTIHAN